MRLFPPFLLVCLAASVFACVHEERRVTGVAVSTEQRPATPQQPPQWLIGDPAGSRTPTMLMTLHADTYGMIVDKRRIVVARGEPRVASDIPSDTLAGHARIPSRMGGGFLFWTSTSLYRADQYDGKLVPIASIPSSIDTVSMGPGYVLVRANTGERWGIGLPKGDRITLAPLGLVDIAASEDGHAIAYDDRKAVFTSTDNGAHWTDVTAQMHGGAPTRVFRTDSDEVWLVDQTDAAMRLEPDGRLAWFDKAPADDTADFRPKDARWHGAEPPLRVAVRQGVALDERTALVLEGGDLVRIDTHTGEIVSVYGGHLPPDSFCQGLQVGGDVVFACLPRGNPNQGAPFVVSHVLGGEPVIEQTFAVGGEFYASDDGGLAYSGSCNGTAAAPNGVPAVCVRMPSGQWEERDLGMLSVDGGAAPGEVVRWIPRADGRVVALIGEPTPGIYDPASGVLQDVSEEVTNMMGGGRNSYARGSGKYRYLMKQAQQAGAFVDTSWSYIGTTLRGQGVRGETFEITDDGKVKMSAYDLEGTFSGPLGLGKSKDGRIYQTNDRGLTWTEVAAPPTGDATLEIVACSSVGCDLNAFYRVGWQLRPPQPALAPEPAAAVPALNRVRGIEMTCRPSGPIASKVMPREQDTTDDLGLGASKLPVPDEKNSYAYVRTPANRGIAGSWWPGGAQTDPSDTESSSALRALLSGYSATKNEDTDVLQVNGPNKNILGLRRTIAYVAPFDLQGKVIRTGVTMPEVIAAGRRGGLSNDEILESDPTDTLLPFPIASADANSIADLGLYNSDRSLLAVVRGERTRVAFRVNTNASSAGGNVTFSGVALPNDEVALLEYDSDSVEHVYKLGASSTMTDIYDIEPPNQAYHSANPDVVAVGPKGELGVLRTPSGADPPSASDPAYVVIPGLPSVALAPWSTVKLAEDPACKAEPGGWRAVVQAIGPWVKVSTPELHVGESPMLARVRWSDKRVCLEGFEVRLPGVTVKPTGTGGGAPVSVGTWLVERGGQYVRISVADGIEWRQPLDCAITSTSP